MRLKCLLAVTIIVGGIDPALKVSAKEIKDEKPTGWGYLRGGPLELRSRPTARMPGFLRLGQGTIVSVVKWESHGGTTWALVRALDLSKLTPQVGWAESDRMERLPPGRFPADGDILRQLGSVYLDDFTASHTAIARWLVRRGTLEACLVCFIASSVLPTAKLIAFHHTQGGFFPGPSLEFPLSDTPAGIVAAEVRDLRGDGNECLITHEPFRTGPERRGINLVIRAIEARTFKTLWQAPLEFRNLEAYSPKLQVLQPPEMNVGDPGTVTTGEVSFRPHGNTYEPVWKGKVEFYVVGREQPVESVTIERACPWDGEKFAPLR